MSSLEAIVERLLLKDTRIPLKLRECLGQLQWIYYCNGIWKKSFIALRNFRWNINAIWNRCIYVWTFTKSLHIFAILHDHFLMTCLFAAGDLYAVGPLQLLETPSTLLVRCLRAGLLGTCDYANTSLQVSVPFRKKRLRACLNHSHASMATYVGLWPFPESGWVSVYHRTSQSVQ